ncbi:MAG: methyltransferase, partial [Ferruginibacter sp.]
MKVCTDACILGSYSARQISKDQQVVANILDIGTGTGLLSLMIAQKTNAMIDALEIDADAFNQALDNFTQSSWKNRLNIFNEDAIFFRTGKKYDFIIC